MVGCGVGGDDDDAGVCVCCGTTHHQAGGGGGGGGAAAAATRSLRLAAQKASSRNRALLESEELPDEDEYYEQGDEGWFTEADAVALPQPGWWYTMHKDDRTPDDIVCVVVNVVHACERVLSLRTRTGHELLVPWTPRLRFEKGSPCGPTRIRTPPPWTIPPPQRWTGTCAFVTDSRACGASVDVWPFCRKHLREAYKVEIRASTVPGAGDGLFTTEKIIIGKGGRHMVPYCAELISTSTYGRRYPDGSSTYVMACRSEWWLLDATVRRGVGSMANCSSHNKANAYFVHRPMREQVENPNINPAEYTFVWLEMRRTMEASTELFVFYNDASWIRLMKSASIGL